MTINVSQPLIGVNIKPNAPVAPKIPTKPEEPTRSTMVEHKENVSNFIQTNGTTVTLSKFLELVPKGISYSDCSLQIEYFYGDGHLMLCYTHEVVKPEKQYAREMKVYTKQIQLYEKQMIKYEDDLEGYRMLKEEWEQKVLIANKRMAQKMLKEIDKKLGETK